MTYPTIKLEGFDEPLPMPNCDDFGVGAAGEPWFRVNDNTKYTFVLLDRTERAHAAASAYMWFKGEVERLSRKWWTLRNTLISTSWPGRDTTHKRITGTGRAKVESETEFAITTIRKDEKSANAAAIIWRKVWSATQ